MIIGKNSLILVLFIVCIFNTVAQQLPTIIISNKEEKLEVGHSVLQVQNVLGIPKEVKIMRFPRANPDGQRNTYVYALYDGIGLVFDLRSLRIIKFYILSNKFTVFGLTVGSTEAEVTQKIEILKNQGWLSFQLGDSEGYNIDILDKNARPRDSFSFYPSTNIYIKNGVVINIRVGRRIIN